MGRLLNILAALLLVVVPVMRPCDCGEFKFFCDCALGRGAKAHAVADPAVVPDDAKPCCGCGKSESSEHSSAASEAKEPSRDSSPHRAPASPRKSGTCLKFVVAELEQAAPSLPAAPVLTADMVVTAWFVRPLAAEHIQHGHDHFERPPPTGLLLVRICCLRI